MELSTTKCCCFCKKDFKKLGNHYKGCPERNGRDYDHLLSQKTLAKREKTRKSSCPNCGKSFLRLETHLRNSATCKSISQISQSTPEHSGFIPQDTRTSRSVSSPQLPNANDPPPSMDLLHPIQLPSTKDSEWQAADHHFKENLVPQLL